VLSIWQKNSPPKGGRTIKTYNNLNYFLVLSAFIFDVSVVTLADESTLTTVESTLTTVESVVLVAESAELLQATNTVATDRIARIFFMTCCFKGFYNSREDKIFYQKSTIKNFTYTNDS